MSQHNLVDSRAKQMFGWPLTLPFVHCDLGAKVTFCRQSLLICKMGMMFRKGPAHSRLSTNASPLLCRNHTVALRIRDVSSFFRWTLPAVGSQLVLAQGQVTCVKCVSRSFILLYLHLIAWEMGLIFTLSSQETVERGKWDNEWKKHWTHRYELQYQYSKCLVMVMDWMTGWTNEFWFSRKQEAADYKQQTENCSVWAWSALSLFY